MTKYLTCKYHGRCELNVVYIVLWYTDLRFKISEAVKQGARQAGLVCPRCKTKNDSSACNAHRPELNCHFHVLLIDSMEVMVVSLYFVEENSLHKRA